MKTIEQKRQEAAERQAAYSEKPNVEKLKTAGKKERRKLLRKMENESKV